MEHRDLTDAEFAALREIAAGAKSGESPHTRGKSPELETLCDIGYVDPVTTGGFYLTDMGRNAARAKGWLD